ncbi:MAG: succinate--CoA ligase subunit alpha, partial [Candidatus Lokiarchaeota archaeon]|nr:succinate--CoA ligase subunit alpha [Candidatus Lokiarchaeota archaeon]MBD3342124.1 succinate--CoA ligase subunit alpha [Candidatus Lokiarchaeota archaeon]
PNKGGEFVYGIPVFNDVEEAVKKKGCDTSIIFVPARFAYNAVLESLKAGIRLTCVITEGIPILDTLRLIEFAKSKGLHIIGPNCPGMLIPDKIKLGIMPSDMCHFGNIAIISKSGTLSYEITKAIGNAGIGVSAYVGIGGDPVRGINMIEAVKYYSKDKNTDMIVLIGEIGSDEEEKTAEFMKKEVKKPVIAYVAGKSAPEGKRMGHAGAIISGDFGTAQGKIKALEKAGAHIANDPWEIPYIIKKIRQK